MWAMRGRTRDSHSQGKKKKQCSKPSLEWSPTISIVPGPTAFQAAVADVDPRTSVADASARKSQLSAMMSETSTEKMPEVARISELAQSTAPAPTMSASSLPRRPSELVRASVIAAARVTSAPSPGNEWHTKIIKRRRSNSSGSTFPMHKTYTHTHTTRNGGDTHRWRRRR